MDFHALSRRELQALCKRNAVRANMSNAAMADALQSLPSVDGLHEIGRTAAPPMSAREVIIEEEKIDRSPLPRGGRARSKAMTAAADTMEQDLLTLQGSQGAAAREAVAPVEEVEEVIGEEQGHGCPLPRGGRARAKTRKAVAHKSEEVVLAPDTLQGSHRTTAGEGMAPVEAEEVATGKRTRRSARSKVKMALDQKEEVPAAVRKEVVSDKSCDDPKEHEVVTVVEEDIIKGQNVTRRPAAHEMEEEVPAPVILRRSQRTAAPVEAEEVATAKKRTRRSTRSKVAATARKGQNADSSDVAIGSTDMSSDRPKEDEVVAVVEEEATKPLEGGNVTMPVAHKTEEVPAPATLQQSQRTAALEAAAPVEAEEVATTKRRRRRARSKVAAAARDGKKADSSDAATIGSPVLVSDQSCDNPKEEQLVAVAEEHVTKPKEEEQDQRCIVHKSASMVKVEDPPTVSILSKVETADVPDKTAAANEETIKEDGFSGTGEVDQSNLLVNTLDRFAKPVHEFTVKGEKKEGECWWMLM
ncbi:hypothetical protein BAE44_0020802 [Dichanthelium oligosanthes]|uniref:Uncharacterized protein n=1 Tax=Dichanthelium oligosanthes TaxID=888268 RepID=A0A1E5UZ64_9POAL|nr:hypothetical protein BAE44_0020802 [Dichanthelium oligosanthes]